MTDWRPMATAPKDGSWILLRGRNSAGRPMVPVVVSWRTDRGGRDPHAWRDSSTLGDLTELAVYGVGQSLPDWQPLPDWALS